MPTPACHTQSLIAGMLSSASDKAALIAAGVAGSTPLWYESVKQISDAAAILGPTLAAVFVGSKIVLTWVQIWRAARGGKSE
jgi:hypothetical protein